MFVDEVRVEFRAGDGGNGCCSFRRERFRPKGGPDGGNGGKGGDVVLIGDENVSDLISFKFKPHGSAGNGEGGRGNDQSGKKGRDLLNKLPLGTVVIDEGSGEEITELVNHEQRYVLLKGGEGGRGNRTFKSSVNRTPRETSSGRAGEHGWFRLIIKTIANVGLVGYPNAGKSSLTRRLTAARPKTAAYPFTTLAPHVGVIDYPEHFESLTLADIPGLVDGAHQNRGLGHCFLRHIERCHLLLFVIDLSGADGRNPIEDFRQLLYELTEFNRALVERPRIVALNKIDKPETLENLAAFRDQIEEKTLPTSCLTGEGIEALKVRIRAELRASEREPA